MTESTGMRRAEREGPVRITWSRGSYTDYLSREEALTDAAGPETATGAAVRMEDEAGTILEGHELEEALQKRRAASHVYESVRLDPRLEELGIGIERLTWNGDDALYSFSGYGPHMPKAVSGEKLLTERPADIADSLIRWVAKEIEFRNHA